MILVTGGTGYIGSNTVSLLLNNGKDVVIVDNFSNSTPEVLAKLESITNIKVNFEELDLMDSDKLKAVFEKYPISSIIHFAGLKAVGDSVDNPIGYYRNNISGLFNLLECAKDYEVKSFVFSSSCTVYGVPETIPVKEDSAVQTPSSPYGNTKKIGEEILAEFSHFTDLKVVNLRYFNPIGADDSFTLGDNPTGVPTNLLPYLTRVAAGELEALSVFGTDYDTPDGTCVRDYIHVVDLAEAHIQALEYVETKMGEVDFETFNLGTGNGYTVLEIIKAFEEAAGFKVNTNMAPRRKGDIPSIYADPAKAKNILGWEAKRSLRDMMVSSWKFQQKLNVQN